jgi:hypothetical protein
MVEGRLAREVARGKRSERQQEEAKGGSMKTFGVGQSKVNAWRNCHQAYHYKYVEELQRRTTRRPFVFGRFVHSMIEEDAAGREPLDVLENISMEDEKLFTAEKEMYGELIEDLGIIMKDYFDYWKPDHPKYMHFLAITGQDGIKRFAEHEFAIDIGDGITFKGQIDSVVQTPNMMKMRWLGENKSFDKLPSEDHRWRNLQSVVYMRALEMLGWVKGGVEGVCWNYIKSKPPTVPQLLKNGVELSVRDIVTLPSVVRDALKRHKLDPSLPKHIELMKRADASRDEYFQRIFTPINKTVSANIWSGFVESARDMRDHHGRKKDKNLGRHCEWCDYESICRAELTGGDVDFVKEREYTHEDPEAYRRSGREAKRSAKLRVVGEGAPREKARRP